VVRQRSAKPLFVGSTPIRASNISGFPVAPQGLRGFPHFISVPLDS
jgi:hypothetical protein